MGRSFLVFMYYFLDKKDGISSEVLRVAKAACQAYMLRDIREDLCRGYINIDRESIEKFEISLKDIDGKQFQLWMQYRIDQIESDLNAREAIIAKEKHLRDKLVFLLFIAPRQIALLRIKKNCYRPLRNSKLRFSDYTWIVLNVLTSLFFGGGT
jgi:phytoene/squalene synthetase